MASRVLSEVPSGGTSARSAGLGHLVSKSITDPAPGEVVVVARKAFHVFRRRQQWKRLCLYCAFFASYVAYVNLIIDWSHGGRTVEMYRTALTLVPGVDGDQDIWCDPDTRRSSLTNETCWWNYASLQTVNQLFNFMHFQFDEFPVALRKICPRCLVGITASAGTVQTIPLVNYACTDFDPKPGLEKYPPRDCEVVDATWSENPSVDSEPCCSHNKTLVQASIALIGQNHADSSVRSAPLESLLEPAATSQHSVWTKEWVMENIRTDGQFLQIIIVNEPARIIGINFLADWKYGGTADQWESSEDVWAQRILSTSNTFWSRRWDADGLERGLNVLCWLSAAGGLFHSLVEAWSTCITKEDWMQWLGLPGTWLSLLTAFFPLVAALGEGILEPIAWVTIIAITEMLLLVRFLMEGEVIPACRILLRTITVAVRQLTTLSVILISVLLVMSTIYGQLFGVFQFSSWEAAFFEVIDQFGNGATLLPQAELYNEVGSKMMYLLSMFVLSLTLSQFFITVLIGAFDTARSISQESKMHYDAPDKYQHQLQERGWKPYLLDLLVGSFTYYLPSYSTTKPQLMRALKKAITELEAAYPALADEPIGLSVAHARKCLDEVQAGPKAVRRLLEQFGAAPCQPRRQGSPTRSNLSCAQMAQGWPPAEAPPGAGAGAAAPGAEELRRILEMKEELVAAMERFAAAAAAASAAAAAGGEAAARAGSKGCPL